MSRFLPNFREMNILTEESVKIHLEISGRGEPLLLVHGYPQTHLIWHKIAPQLAEKYTVILPDMRGYGDSDCPAASEDHSEYSNRSMANDMISIMRQLGHTEFYCCGHDRGARICMQMAMDHPEIVKKCMLLDIIPEYDLYSNADDLFSRVYFHWYFLIQPELPEALIGANPIGFLRKFARFDQMPEIFTPDIVTEYERCFSRPEVIYGSTEDYRASAGLDLEIQKNALDNNIKIKCPLLVLYAGKGLMSRYSPEEKWKAWAENPNVIQIKDCGHFMPEEKPEIILKHILDFMK